MGAFDKIAKPKDKVTTTKSSKKVASVTPNVKVAVDQVIKCKAGIAKLKAEQEEFEGTIIDHVRPQQDNDARDGNFSKTYLVEGHEGNLSYNTADSFSVPQDEDSQEALRDMLGDKYDTWFKTKRVISLKEGIEKNEKLIDQIFEVITKAGLDPSDVFNAVDTVVAADDLDRKQYDLNQERLEVFRSIVKQRKAALK